MNTYHVLGIISVSVTWAVEEARLLGHTALTEKGGQPESNGRWLCMGGQESFLLGDFAMWAELSELTMSPRGRWPLQCKAVCSTAGVGRSDCAGEEVVSTGSLGRSITKPHKNFEYYPRYEWVLILNFLWLFTYMHMCAVLREVGSHWIP